MGLASSLSKVLSLTQKIGAYPQTLLPIKFDTGVLDKVFGMEGQLVQINSVSDAKNFVQGALSNLTQGANLINCGIHTLSNYNIFLGQLASGLTVMAARIADEFFDVIMCQINSAVSQIIGGVISIIKAVHDIWTSMVLLWKSLENLYESWTTWSNINFEWKLNEENCIDMYASIVACLLNKLLGEYISSFKHKVISEIDKFGNDLNAQIYDKLNDTRVISQFADRQSFLLKKASLQINGLTKENLLNIT